MASPTPAAPSCHVYDVELPADELEVAGQKTRRPARRIRFFGAELTQAQARRLLERVRRRYPTPALRAQDLAELDEEIAADEWQRWEDAKTRMNVLLGSALMSSFPAMFAISHQRVPVYPPPSTDGDWHAIDRYSFCTRILPWVVRRKGEPPLPGKTGQGEENGGEDDAKAIADLEKATPPLDKDSGKWVSNKRAAKIEGLETRTLSSYRRRGIKNADGSLGRDPDRRIWRREGTPGSHPWYLRSSLRSQQNR